jgi:hypothetical protein
MSFVIVGTFGPSIAASSAQSDRGARLIALRARRTERQRLLSYVAPKPAPGTRVSHSRRVNGFLVEIAWSQCTTR